MKNQYRFRRNSEMETNPYFIAGRRSNSLRELSRLLINRRNSDMKPGPKPIVRFVKNEQN